MMYMFLICYDPAVGLGPDDPQTLQPDTPRSASSCARRAARSRARH